MDVANAERLLGVSPLYGRNELRRAWRAAAMHWHPDHNPDPNAHRTFLELAEAYRLLQNAPLGRRAGSAGAGAGEAGSWPRYPWGQPVSARPQRWWEWPHLVPIVELVRRIRSEEHTSELQSLRHLVCRLLLEKKKK